jgi:hypothetical protein
MGEHEENGMRARRSALHAGDNRPALGERGLVVGDVEPVRPPHYAGVINRAAAAGYRVIVVLAGMHNVLRLQTQQRLEATFSAGTAIPSHSCQMTGAEPLASG